MADVTFSGLLDGKSDFAISEESEAVTVARKQAEGKARALARKGS